MSNPSFTERTAIEFGEELQIAGTGEVRSTRTGNFTQIPVYEAFNPVNADGETQPLRRAKPTLDPDGFGIGQMSYGIAGQLYVYGSGIANIPPDWFRVLKICGCEETRLAIHDIIDVGTLLGTPVGSGGYLSAGTYKYSFTQMLTTTGLAVATTEATKAFESRPTSAPDTEVIVVANGSVTVSGLPSAGIKRLYRTIVGGSIYYYVDEIPDGETTYTDVLADVNLGRRMVLDSSETTGTLAAAESASGTVLDGTYLYKYTSLYDADGAYVTDSAAAVWESSSCTGVSVSPAKKGVDVTGLPSNGVKRLYRTVASGSTYYFVREVPHGETAVSAAVYTGPEQLSDVTLITQAPLVEAVSEAIYTPVSDYDDFHSMTVQSYLDSRKLPATGVRGNMTFGGEAGRPVPINFELRGVYSASSKIANPVAVANPGIPPQLCGANFAIDRYSSDTWQTQFVPKLRAFGVNLGRSPVARSDGNAACANAALLEFMIATTPDPHFTCTIEVDEDQNFEEYFKNGDTFALTIQIGTSAREKTIISNYTPWGYKSARAQLAAPPTYDGGDDGIRLMNLDFKLCGINNDYIRIRHTV